MTTSVASPSGGGKQDFAHVPQELKDCAQWVLHKNKAPFQPNGSPASVTDPTTWSPFTDALKRLQGGDFDGLSFVVTADDPYTVVDIDHCREPGTGEIAPTAQAIIDEVDSYSEVSLSDTGVHIIARASVPGGRKVDGIEVHSSGRCFVMTGQHLEGTPLTIENRDEVVNEVYGELSAHQQKRGTAT